MPLYDIYLRVNLRVEVEVNADDSGEACMVAEKVLRKKLASVSSDSFVVDYDIKSNEEIL